MNDSDMERPLVDNVAKFDQLTEQISEKIDLLREYIEMLNEYKSKMGTADDTRSMRRRMQAEITEGNELIKQILDLQQEMDDIKFKKRKDIENYNKMSRRLNNTFDDYYEKFTKVLKEIHSKEKIHLDIRQSDTHTLNASITGMSASDAISDHNGHQGYQEPQETVQFEAIEEVRNNLEFYQSIISERENLRASIRKAPIEEEIPTEDVTRRLDEDYRDLENPMEHVQSHVIHTQSVERTDLDNTEDREIREIREVENIDSTIQPTEKRRKRRVGHTAIKNIALTLVVFIACVIVALLIYFNSDGS